MGNALHQVLNQSNHIAEQHTRQDKLNSSRQMPANTASSPMKYFGDEELFSGSNLPGDEASRDLENHVDASDSGFRPTEEHRP